MIEHPACGQRGRLLDTESPQTLRHVRVTVSRSEIQLCIHLGSGPLCNAHDRYDSSSVEFHSSIPVVACRATGLIPEVPRYPRFLLYPMREEAQEAA